MRNPMCRTLVWLSTVLQTTSLFASANTSVHTSWLWHLHQPIYWPDRAPENHPTLGLASTVDHYQNAWDTLQLDNSGFGHPSDTSLSSVFGEADRLNAYQGEPNTVLQDLNSYANSGAQVNYSGALMENVQSLAEGDPSMGYSTTWYSGDQQAHTWTTTNGKTRLDLTNFTYHHCIAPFVSDETLEMDILIHQRQQQIFWGSGATNLISRGYFPAETCFSERIIPTLQKLGIAWSVVGNNHLTRSCADFPQVMVLGSGGENCDIPNLADQINPVQGTSSYTTRSISVGCSPTATAPFAYQMHYARYVDPTTGDASTIIVVPADEALSWDDSYSTWDLSLISPIAAANNPSKPSFLLLAHDGDNAWGGGYTYYNTWVPQFAQEAASDGYEPSTVEEFLSEFPPSTNDIVHVEDGGWVNAAGDFGSPIYVNWHWPPSILNSSPNVVDPSVGVSSKADVWRVITATENRVKTAQQIENTLNGYTNRIDQIRDPGSYGGTPSAVELGWHYYLAGLDSGFVYYGCTADECWRPVLAQSNAVRNVDSILAANPSLDTTPPTVFIPQRYPYNPGTTNFGVEYSYKQYIPTNTDFWVWTYAYDVSGITNVTLLYRSNGSSNPPTQDEFKTYAGGPNTGPWVGLSMTDRSVAPQSTVLPPKYIADYYYAKVIGLTNTYVDYYVSATDSYGNTYNSPIQHVYVAPMPTGGSGGGTGGGATGCDGRFCVSPTTPVAGNPVTITYSAAGGPLTNASQICLHLGWNDWGTVVSPDASMTFNSASNDWTYVTTVPTNATQLDCDANNCSGTWDNNNGSDYKFAVTTGPIPTPPNTPTNVVATAASATEIDLSWSASSNATSYAVYRSGSQLATTATTSYDDLTVAPNTEYCYTIVGVNSGGNSAPSTPACATTPTAPAPSTPTNVVAIAEATNEINVTWSASTGAAAYIVERGGTPVATVSTTSYLDSSLVSNTLYCYSVSASNSAGTSAFSSSACATTPASTGGGNECIGRFCVSPAPPVVGDVATITYYPAGGPLTNASPVYLHLGWNSWATVVSPDAAMTAVSNTWVYTVTVSSTATQMDCDANNGNGTWDNNSGADYKFAVASAPPQAPTTPTNIVATTAGLSQINVSWSASSGATGYVVDRNGLPVGSTAATSFSDVELQMNTQYCYTIAATNSVGSSAQSAPACATTLAFQMTGIAIQGSNVLLTWVAPEGSTNVVQATDGGAGGSYAANFLPIGPPIIIPGSEPESVSTNYLDIGGATNSPSRYYRIALTNVTGLVTTQAFDNAAQPAYSGSWTNGSNGGFGLGAWTLATSIAGINSNGFFVGSSTNNAAGASPGIDTSGESWAMYANSGNTSVAYRAFASSVPVGGTLKIDMRNGYINTGGIDGFTLRHGNVTGSTTNYAAGARLQYYFVGGGSDYTVVDSGGARSTGVGFTGTGQHLVFALGTNDAYTLTIIDNASGTTNATMSGTLAGTSGSSVDSISLFDINAGANTPYNLYFNSLNVYP
jgi:hypothetical protein